MKNEKFCFNKQTGLIALVGVVLVGLVVVMANLANTSTSTNTRASTGTLFTDSTGIYARTQAECHLSAMCAGPLMNTYKGYGYKCTSVGSCAGKDYSQTPPANISFICSSAKSGTYAKDGTYDYNFMSDTRCEVQSAPVIGGPAKCTDVDPVTGTKGAWYMTSIYSNCPGVEAAMKSGSFIEKISSDARLGSVCCQPVIAPKLNPTQQAERNINDAKISARANNLCYKKTILVYCCTSKCRSRTQEISDLTSTSSKHKYNT